MSYPSEGVPDDLIVVIKNIENGSTFQIRNWDRISLKYSAELDTPGNHEVYAITDEMKGYKAYYSEFLRYGSSYDYLFQIPIVLILSAEKNQKKTAPTAMQLNEVFFVH